MSARHRARLVGPIVKPRFRATSMAIAGPALVMMATIKCFSASSYAAPPPFARAKMCSMSAWATGGTVRSETTAAAAPRRRALNAAVRAKCTASPTLFASNSRITWSTTSPPPPPLSRPLAFTNWATSRCRCRPSFCSLAKTSLRNFTTSSTSWLLVVLDNGRCVLPSAPPPPSTASSASQAATATALTARRHRLSTAAF